MGGCRCWQRGGFRVSFAFLDLSARSGLRGVGLGNGDRGRTGANLGAAAIVDPFHRPYDTFFSIFQSDLVKHLDSGDAHPDLGFQNVLFCFARAIPAGAFLTITPHLSNVSFNRTSPFIGPLRPPFLHLRPRSSSSSSTTPLSVVSRSAPSSFRSMLVRKLKSWSMPRGVARSARGM